MAERCDDKPQNYDEIQSTINVYEECGRNKAETARKMGIRRGTVITRIQQAEALGLIQDYKTKVQETVAEGMEVFGVAEVEKRNAEQAQNPNRVNATCRYQPEESEQESIADQWRDAEEKSIKRIRRSLERHYFDVEFPDDGGPIAIAAISDQHIAPGTPVDFRQMRIDAELVRDTPGVYAMLGGDGVDQHIKHRSAMIAARSTPDDQWKLFNHYLDIFAEKIISVVSGNHDDFVVQLGGINMLEYIARGQSLCYAPDHARITAHVGKQKYELAIRHKYRYGSTLNQVHTVKRWFDMGEEPFDCGVICHHHEAAMEAFQKHGRMRWGARPGSYQISSSYSRANGFNPSIPTCPTFVLFPDEHRIIGFSRLQDAVWAMQKG